jgi:hypothetical protein
MDERTAIRMAMKQSSSEEQWELAAEILAKKEEHDAIKAIKAGYEDVLKSIAEAEKRSKGMQRMGVGRTEDPTLVLTMVVPAIQELSETCAVIVEQMQKRLSGQNTLR